MSDPDVTTGFGEPADGVERVRGRSPEPSASPPSPPTMTTFQMQRSESWHDSNGDGPGAAEARTTDTTFESADDSEGETSGEMAESAPAHDATAALRVDAEQAEERWLHLTAETPNVPVARHYVRRVLQSLLPVERLDAAAVDDLTADLELAASELVTNAVEHSGGDSLELSVSCDGDAVALEVVSFGEVEQVGPARNWEIADVGSVTGRGLGIVRAVSDRVAVRRERDTLTIRIERDLPPA